MESQHNEILGTKKFCLLSDIVISVVHKQYKTKEINSLGPEKLVCLLCYIRYFVISDLFISSFRCIPKRWSVSYVKWKKFLLYKDDQKLWPWNPCMAEHTRLTNTGPQIKNGKLAHKHNVSQWENYQWQDLPNEGVGIVVCFCEFSPYSQFVLASLFLESTRIKLRNLLKLHGQE